MRKDLRIGETTVLLNFCSVILSRLWPQKASPQSPTDQQALQWWHQRQLARQHQSAELIRDGSLQHLFAIRRTLELACSSPQDTITPPQIDQLVAQLDTLHADLETVSNTLSPPFAHDDLALGIQYILQHWQQQHSSISVSLSLHPQPQRPIMNHHLVLMMIVEWLDILTPLLSDAAQLSVTLDVHDHDIQLILGVQEPQEVGKKAIAQQPTLPYLCQSFRLLSGGEVTDNIHQNGPWQQWHFCWPKP